jgi:uncharacterized membrane-anchored protein YjiN (DUF445 family)
VKGKNTKVLATTLLLIALIGLLVSWQFRQNYWGGMILVTCQAALAGALADWFAVVALFRHPLGMKFIPHTAIIPKNRERIIDSIVNLVENEWLNQEMIKEKIEGFKIFESFNKLIQSEEGKKRLEEVVFAVFYNTLNEMEPQYVAKFAQDLIKAHASEIKMSWGFIEDMEESVKKLYAEDIVDFIIDNAKHLINNEEFMKIAQHTLRKVADDYSEKGFFRRIGKGLGERLDIINYREASKSVAYKLIDVLNGMKSKSSPYRAKMKQGIMSLEISKNPDIIKAIENWLTSTIENADGEKILTEIVKALKNQVFAGGAEGSPIVKYFTEMAINQLDKISKDDEKKGIVEKWIKEEVLKLIERYHSVIGNLVRENLEKLNDESFTTSLEDKVGEDLQWIRVNGTVIGGLVGLLQYLILR